MAKANSTNRTTTTIDMDCFDQAALRMKCAESMLSCIVRMYEGECIPNDTIMIEAISGIGMLLEDADSLLDNGSRLAREDLRISERAKGVGKELQ
jgi:hypothetical protein